MSLDRKMSACLILLLNRYLLKHYLLRHPMRLRPLPFQCSDTGRLQ